MWKKPLWMLSIFVPVKKKALRENYRKFLISLPWKKKPTREKILRSVREKFHPPVKNSKKVCVKAIFHPSKKSKKGQKKLSRALLIFTGKKKTLLFSTNFRHSQFVCAIPTIPLVCFANIFCDPDDPLDFFLILYFAIPTIPFTFLR